MNTDDRRVGTDHTRRAFLKDVGRVVGGLTIGGTLLSRPRKLRARDRLPDVVNIGFLQPLTGPLADTGRKIREGAELIVERINAAGGIAGKVKVNAIYGDSKGDPTEGVTVVQRMIAREGLHMLAGDFSSSVSLAVQPILARQGVLFFTYSFAPELTQRGIRTSFRLGPWSHTVIPPLAKYAVEDRGHRTFAVLCENNDWGRSLTDIFKETARALNPNVEFVSEDFYPFGNTDFTSYLTKIRDLNPDGIVAMNYEPAAIQVTRQYAELNLTSQIYGSDLYAGPDYYAAVGELAERVVFEDYWWRQPGTGPEEVQAFYTEFRQRFGREAEHLNTWAYLALDVYRQAVEGCGSVDSEAVADYMLQGHKFHSLFGEYQFEPCGQATVQAGVATWRNGQTMYVKDIGYGSELLTYCA